MMNLTDAIAKYVDAWAAPTPDPSAAFEVIDEFCNSNPSLDGTLVSEFEQVLRRKEDRWLPQLFIANVLLHFRKFDRSLMAPMLQAAIDNPDPSSNRDFLTPCLYSFGAGDVVDWLVNKFGDANLIERVGIDNLVYWLDGYPVDVEEMRQRQTSGFEVREWLRSHEIDASSLKDEIEEAAKSSKNIIELYFYRTALPDRQHLFSDIPRNAEELKERIAGEAHYEHLLYHQLEWPRA